MGVEWMVSSSAMIFLVVLIRFMLRRKMQPHICYALWLAVAFRLLLPVSFSETAVSVLNFLPEEAQEGTGDENGPGESRQEGNLLTEKGLRHEQLTGKHLTGKFPAEKQPAEIALSESGPKQDGGGTGLAGDSAEGAANWTEAGLQESGEAAGNLPEGMYTGRNMGAAGTEPEQNQGMVREEESAEGQKQDPEGTGRLKAGKPDIGRLFRYIWLSGTVLCGIVLLAVNLDYGRRLGRSRKRSADENLPIDSEIPVYIAGMVQTPCLFGLLRPAIYVTEAVAGEEKVFAYVLCHENVHYRHHDNWWVLVRNLCLCLHWYNPFVWLAAHLSRQDAELACDEKVLEKIGRENRVDYGRALLEVSIAGFSGISGWRISTAMGGGKRQMKERLQMLVEAPGKTMGVRIFLLLLMAFVFAVAFTGRSGQSFAALGQGTEDILAGDSSSVDVRIGEKEDSLEESVNAGFVLEDETGKDAEEELVLGGGTEKALAMEEGVEEEPVLGAGTVKEQASGEYMEEERALGARMEKEPALGNGLEEKMALGAGMQNVSAAGNSPGEKSAQAAGTENAMALDDGMEDEQASGMGTKKAMVLETGLEEELTQAAEMEGTGWQDEGGTGENVLAKKISRTRLINNGQGNLELDLNFDGWDDLCIPGEYNGGENIPYDCMVWDQQTQQYGQSVRLYNVDTDEANQWITSRVEEGDGQYSITYYHYDEDGQLHMIRYVEENQSGDAVFSQLDLTYVEEGGAYDLPAIVDGTGLHYTFLAMAKQALEELYQWTGDKVSTACFQVSNMGGVFFGMTPEDIRHSRIFLSRSFGADTEYNLSNYERAISDIIVSSGRSVWYSPVLWRVFPDDLDDMTDEEAVRWYFERLPTSDDGKVKNVIKRYEDMWTVQAESGRWFEVCYDAKLREVWYVTGPYPDFPEH